MSYIGNSPSSIAFLTDTFNGTGSQTAYTLSAAPASTSSILVAVSGVLQDPSTYGVTGLTLNFSAAPPSGTGNISVRYLGVPASGVTTTAYRTVTEFTATASQTTFTPPSYTVGFINVYRNGVLLGSADYTATNGTTVVLASGATSGDLVTVESFQVSSVLNAIPNSPASVGTTNLVDGSVTTAKIADNSITTAKIAAGAVVQADLASGVAGTGPAFSAYQTSAQTLSSNTQTKIQLQTVEFDTNSCFDSTTNYRFTPNVAGYYQVTAHIQPSATYTAGIVGIYKNGSVLKYGAFNQNGTAVAQGVVTCLVYLNGSTDYVEFYASFVDGQIVAVGSQFTWFQGFMARAA